MEKRIQKIISECGITSRRKAEDLIMQGKVKINGRIAKIGEKADIDKDSIIVLGKELKKQKHVYLAINKPLGLVTSTKDPHEETIMKIIPAKYDKFNLYPIGRLDKNTEGLLFMTNDGDFANRLIHPRYKVEKRYEGLIEGSLSKDEFKKLQTGITLEEGLAKCRLYAKPSGENTYFIMKIHTGWNKQVRRMMEAVGHKVLKLRRISIANFEITNLGKKRTKELTKKEIEGISEAIKDNPRKDTKTDDENID